MRKGIIVNFKKFRLLNNTKINKTFIMLSLFFIAGITVSVFVFNKNTTFADFSKKIFDNYISIHISSSFLKKFFATFLKYFIVLIIYFLFGTSMLGVAVIPFLTFWQGILYGNISAYLYTVYALKGIAFNAIVLVPPTIVFTVCTFFAAKDSVNFSLLIAKLTFPNSKPASMFVDFRKLCTKYIIYICITVISVIADILLNALFLKFFKL